MKRLVANLVNDALASLPELQEAAADLSMESTVERTRDASHGDFSTNAAMRLAKTARKSPGCVSAEVTHTLTRIHRVLGTTFNNKITRNKNFPACTQNEKSFRPLK